MLCADLMPGRGRLVWPLLLWWCCPEPSDHATENTQKLRISHNSCRFISPSTAAATTPPAAATTTALAAATAAASKNGSSSMQTPAPSAHSLEEVLFGWLVALSILQPANLHRSVTFFTFTQSINIATNFVFCREQITERAAFMSRLVDGLLRGRSPPFARHEAAAAMSEVRAFVRAWRPTTSDRRTGGQGQESEDMMEDGGRQIAPKKPSSDALLKLAQVRHAALGAAHVHARILMAASTP